MIDLITDETGFDTFKIILITLIIVLNVGGCALIVYLSRYFDTECDEHENVDNAGRK